MRYLKDERVSSAALGAVFLSVSSVVVAFARTTSPDYYVGLDLGVGMAKRSQKKEDLDRIRVVIRRGMDNGLSFEDASIEASKLLPDEYKRRGF